MPPKTEKLIKQLKRWCDAKRGRRIEVAEAIGTSKWTISHWFAGRQQPTAEQALNVQDFLKKNG
jgi:hypothetical protein